MTFVPDLTGFGVADVVDVMGQRYRHRAHVLDLVSPSPDRVLFGPAVTISFLPYRQDLMDDRRHTLGPLFYEAIADTDPSGKVLVMASNGHGDVSLGGGTKLSRVRNHAMAGVLADGRLRDFDELDELGVAVWCAGETTKAGGALVRPYQANVPVVLSGVTIVPGDHVLADRSGAVVIPAADVDEVLAAARQMAVMAADMAGMMRNENADEVRRGSDEAQL